MSILASEIIKDFKENRYDDLIKDIYGAAALEEQKDRYIMAVNEFVKLYGDIPASIFRAAGRTEVGGNHTDHQHGKVITAAVNLDSIAVAAPSGNNKVNLKSEGYDPIDMDLDHLDPVASEKETTMALIRGVAAGIKKRNCEAAGFKAYVTSTVLSGSGISSSAAFETLMGNLFMGLFNAGKEVDPVLMAVIGKEAENVYFGKPSGLMDQMGSSVGGLIKIDFKDPENPVMERVGVSPTDLGYALCILDTKGSHANLTGEYAAVVDELSKVCGYFGKKVMRELTEEVFYGNIAKLREVAGDRAVIRGHHMITENKRVDAEFEALKNSDIKTFLNLVKESGNSSYKYLQNVYPSGYTDHQEVSLALALSEDYLGDKGACRVHGGGFAGTIQAFVPDDMVAGYKDYMEKVYGEGACYVLNICKYGGMKVI